MAKKFSFRTMLERMACHNVSRKLHTFRGCDKGEAVGQASVADVLLKNGLVVDGSGGMPYQADVRVRSGRIIEIGPDLASDNNGTVYDVAECYVTPSFIDTHTHYDGALFWDGACDPMPQHGVTTALVGNCGLGMAPTRNEDISEIIEPFSYIEDLPDDVFRSAIPWNWETFSEYIETMRACPLGVTIAVLISHSLTRTDRRI